MEDNQNSTIRILVDALTKSLNELSQKITNYKPVLDRIGTQTDAEFLEIKDIINQTQNITKNLDIVIKSWFERSDTIIKDINELSKTITDLDKKVDKAILTLEQTNTIILDTDKNVKPIGKFATFISKPMGLLVFIIGLFVASYTITTCWNNAVEYFAKIRSPNQQQVE